MIPREERSSLDALRGVPLEVSAQLGTCRLSVAQLLALGEGSVVELDRPAGAPIDVLVGGTIIARGEIVAVGDCFGVRVTEIVSPPAANA
ncbi:MAG TPA: flagellar motor switch protein FliN [Candidatus Tyrphobacter sp.]